MQKLKLTALIAIFAPSALRAELDLSQVSKRCEALATGQEKIDGAALESFHSEAGYRTPEKEPAPDYLRTYSEHRPQGVFKAPNNVALMTELGRGFHSVVYKGSDGAAYKVALGNAKREGKKPSGPENQISLEVELAVNQDLARDLATYNIHVDVIDEIGPHGAYLKRKPFEANQIAGALLEREGLSIVQLRELRRTWRGVKKYAHDKNIHLNFTSDKLYWNGSHWVLFDAGPRFGDRKTKYTTEVESFGHYLKIWNNNYLMLNRMDHVRAFMSGKMDDADVPFFIAHYFPETINLTGRKESKPQPWSKDAAGSTPSERVFGKVYGEFDRTLNAIMFLKWVLAGDLEKITKNQQEPKLTAASLAEIQKFTNETIQSEADWDAMLTYMALHDVAKDKDAGAYFRKLLSSTTNDHDEIMLEAVSKRLDQFPSLVRLNDFQRQKILQSLAARFNMGQWNQAENYAGNLKGLRSITQENLNFYLVHVLGDIAGAKASLPNGSNGNMLMDEGVYNGFRYGFAALQLLKQGHSLQEVADYLLESRAIKLGFHIYVDPKVENPKISQKNRAVARLCVLMNLQNSSDVQPVRRALDEMPTRLREQFISELNRNGVDDSAILFYQLPAFLNNMKKHYSLAPSLAHSFPVARNVFGQTRVIMNALPFANGVYTVDADELKKVTNKPEDAQRFLEHKSVFVVALNGSEAIVHVQDKTPFETVNPDLANIARMINAFRDDALKQAQWEARAEFVGDLRNGRESDEALIAKIPRALPQSRWLTANETRVTVDYLDVPKSEGVFPSQRLFPIPPASGITQYPEFDRTTNKIMFLRWLQMGEEGYKKMTAEQVGADGQPLANQLSLDGFKKLKEFVDSSLVTNEDWEAALAILEIRDLGRVEGIRKYVEHEIGANGLDNDATFVYALRQRPDLFPAFDRLPAAKKEMVIQSLVADTNIGQLIQGENVPAANTPLKSLSEEAYRFKMVIYLASVAGAVGHNKINGNHLMRQDLVDRFFVAEKHLAAYRRGDKSVDEMYWGYLGEVTGLDVSTEFGKAHARLSQQLRLESDAARDELRSVLQSLDGDVRQNLIRELACTKEDSDTSILLYWAPQVYGAVVASKEGDPDRFVKVRASLSFFNQNFVEARSVLERHPVEATVYTVNMEDAKKAALHFGSGIVDGAIVIDSFGSQGRLRVAQSLSELPALEYANTSSVNPDLLEAAKLSRAGFEPDFAVIQGGVSSDGEAIQDHYSGTTTAMNLENEAEVGHLTLPTNIKPHEEIPEWAQATFKDKKFRAVRLSKPVVVVRVWGHGARQEGPFLGYDIPTTKMAVKLGLAVKPEWMNSYENWTLVEIPKGTLVYIGDAAAQKLDATGTVLSGGERQLYVPNSYELWQQGKLREVGSGKVDNRAPLEEVKKKDKAA